MPCGPARVGGCSSCHGGTSGRNGQACGPGRGVPAPVDAPASLASLAAAPGAASASGPGGC
eukprot:13633639-Alexandrium_andersonii.AAC.1